VQEERASYQRSSSSERCIGSGTWRIGSLVAFNVRMAPTPLGRRFLNDLQQLFLHS